MVAAGLAAPGDPRPYRTAVHRGRGSPGPVVRPSPALRRRSSGCFGSAYVLDPAVTAGRQRRCPDDGDVQCRSDQQWVSSPGAVAIGSAGPDWGRCTSTAPEIIAPHPGCQQLSTDPATARLSAGAQPPGSTRGCGSRGSRKHCQHNSDAAPGRHRTCPAMPRPRTGLGGFEEIAGTAQRMNHRIAPVIDFLA